MVRDLTDKRVCPLLIDLSSSDVKSPLSQLQLTAPDSDGMLALLRTINAQLGPATLKSEVLTELFGDLWGKFESDFAAILESTKSPSAPPARTQMSMLEEVLDTTRGMARKLQEIDKRVKPRTTLFDNRDSLRRQGVTLKAQIDALIATGLNEQHAFDAVMRDFIPGGSSQVNTATRWRALRAALDGPATVPEKPAAPTPESE